MGESKAWPATPIETKSCNSRTAILAKGNACEGRGQSGYTLPVFRAFDA